MGHPTGHAAQLGKESSPALPLTAIQGRLTSLILMSLDPLGGLSLEGTVGVPKRQSKGMKEAVGKGKLYGFTNRRAAAQHTKG